VTDPKRWLDDDGDATEAERALLRGGLDAKAPDGKKDAIWAALVGRLPPGAAGGGDGGGGGAGGGGGGGAVVATGGAALATKGKVAAVVVVGLLAVTALVAYPRVKTTTTTPTAPATEIAARTLPEPTPPARPADLPPEPLAVPIAPAPTADPTIAAPAPTTTARPRAPATSSGAIDPDALREESALVSRARDALRGGDPATALATLETARVRFPRGVLGQERQVLTIEALAASGDRTGASRKATAFLKQFPGSPLASRVRPFTE